MQFVASLVALILAVNPLSGLPFVLASDGHAEPSHRAAIRQIGFTVALGTWLAALFGYRLLSAFGISVMAFQTGAGLLLVMAGAQKFVSPRSAAPAVAAATPPARRAFRRLRRTRRRPTTSVTSLTKTAVSPIGVPILVGPAALALCALHGTQYPGLAGACINAVLSLAVGAVVVACYTAASRVRTWLERWHHALTCIVGLVLLCRGIDIVVHALK
jgi:multiple antibiotic resistance protein